MTVWACPHWIAKRSSAHTTARYMKLSDAESSPCTLHGNERSADAVGYTLRRGNTVVTYWKVFWHNDLAQGRAVKLDER